MPDLNIRVESFITLLLDVSGRARPADLEAHAPTGAEELLRAYAAAHPGTEYVSEDGALVRRGAAPAPVSEPPAPLSETLPPHEAAFESAAEPAEPVPSPVEMPSPDTLPVEPAPATAAVEPAFVFDPNSLPEVAVAPPAEPAPFAAPEAVPPLPVIPDVVPQTPGALPALDDSSFFEFSAGGTDEASMLPDASAAPEVSQEPELEIIPAVPEIDEIPELPTTVSSPDLSGIPQIVPLEPVDAEGTSDF